MSEYYCMNMLVYMIIDEECLNLEEMITFKNSIPSCLLAKDFHERLKGVLFVKRRITSCRWRKFFDTCFEQMLSSHEMYVTFIMFACFSEDDRHQNKFESFLSVCSVVKLLCDETFQKTNVDLSYLNPDIVMAFYNYKLKGIFYRRGGFRRLVEYIRDHRYLKLISNWGDVSFHDPSMVYFISPDHPIQRHLDKKLKKELRRESVIEQEVFPVEIATDAICIDLAKEVLSDIYELPSLPSQLDIIKRMTEYKMKKMIKFTEVKSKTKAAEKLESLSIDLNGFSGPNSDSKSDCVAKHQDNFEQHDNIIQAVIRCNNSKSSSNKNVNSRVQEAEILEHLKDKIKSLIEVLDEFDKE